MRFHSIPLACFLAVSTSASAIAQLPSGWRVLPDTVAPDLHGDYVRMPPGWHLSGKGQDASVYDPAWVTGSRYSLEWDAFVFPNTGAEPFGLFLGGRGLEEGTASFVAVQLTALGVLSVVQRAARQTRVIVPPMVSGAFIRPGDEEPARNILRVNVEADSVRILLNGVPAAAFAPIGDLAGTFGFRVGATSNLHVTRLDQVTPLAPPRPARREPR